MNVRGQLYLAGAIGASISYIFNVLAVVFEGPESVVQRIIHIRWHSMCICLMLILELATTDRRWSRSTSD
ncbi:hypothetical protein SAMN05192561_1383 [Halopenitus malekzadehii]|uniref:Uncharacterized protein n=1 Tax=Halopenitus malekzadehii TaxID=1267564 RepID=A0A1H6KBM1_9EURY|nr:hypothetical protein SAMN05192561_1383 [Halopenitus malekzadehii]